jgi:hypothetical protein
MRIVNLTPHPVILCDGFGTVIAAFPSYGLAWVEQSDRELFHLEVNGQKVPVVHTEYGEITGLPDPEDGTRYIVSALVAQAARRTDLLVPSDLIRDSEGRVIGCRRFAVV